MRFSEIINEANPFVWRKGKNGLLQRTITPDDIKKRDAVIARREEDKKDRKLERLQARDDYVPPQYRITRTKMRALGQYTLDRIGGSFPDGDPIDWLIPYVQTHFGRDADVIHLLDLGLRETGHSTGYYKYLEDMWDDISADQPELGLGPNPWK